MNTDKNEKKIYASFFEEKVQDGPIKFLVTDAKYGEIHSIKRGKNFDVVDVTVEVTELDNPASEKETITVRIFEDYKPRTFFHQFVLAVLEGTQTTAFELNKIIGLRGEGKLYQYKSEGSNFSYPQIKDWSFFTPNKKVDEALAKYLEEDSLDNDVMETQDDENDHDHKGVE